MSLKSEVAKLTERVVRVEAEQARRAGIMTQLDAEQHRAQALYDRCQWLAERVAHLEQVNRQITGGQERTNHANEQAILRLAAAEKRAEAAEAQLRNIAALKNKRKR